MVQRSKEMRFAGGAAVFPGGRVDDADRALAQQLGADSADAIDEQAARIAAVRETLEETGLAVGFHQRPSLAEARRARAVLLDTGELAPTLADLGWTLMKAHGQPGFFERFAHRRDPGGLFVDGVCAFCAKLLCQGTISVIHPSAGEHRRAAGKAHFLGALDH